MEWSTSEIETEVIASLVPIFPNLGEDIIKKSVLHPSNRTAPYDKELLLNRCIDDLLALQNCAGATVVDLTVDAEPGNHMQVFEESDTQQPFYPISPMSTSESEERNTLSPLSTLLNGFTETASDVKPAGTTDDLNRLKAEDSEPVSPVVDFSRVTANSMSNENPVLSEKSANLDSATSTISTLFVNKPLQVSTQNSTSSTSINVSAISKLSTIQDSALNLAIKSTTDTRLPILKPAPATSLFDIFPAGRSVSTSNSATKTSQSANGSDESTSNSFLGKARFLSPIRSHSSAPSTATCSCEDCTNNSATGYSNSKSCTSKSVLQNGTVTMPLVHAKLGVVPKSPKTVRDFNVSLEASTGISLQNLEPNNIDGDSFEDLVPEFFNPAVTSPKMSASTNTSSQLQPSIASNFANVSRSSSSNETSTAESKTLLTKVTGEEVEAFLDLSGKRKTNTLQSENIGLGLLFEFGSDPYDAVVGEKENGELPPAGFQDEKLDDIPEKRDGRFYGQPRQQYDIPHRPRDLRHLPFFHQNEQFQRNQYLQGFHRDFMARTAYRGDKQQQSFYGPNRFNDQQAYNRLGHPHQRVYNNPAIPNHARHLVIEKTPITYLNRHPVVNNHPRPDPPQQPVVNNLPRLDAPQPVVNNFPRPDPPQPIVKNPPRPDPLQPVVNNPPRPNTLQLVINNHPRPDSPQMPVVNNVIRPDPETVDVPRFQHIVTRPNIDTDDVPEEVIFDITSELLDLFGEADAAWVREKVIASLKSGNVKTAVCNDMLENGYPKVKIDSAQHVIKKTEEVNYFTDYDDDARLVNSEANRQCQMILKNDFRRLSCNTILRVMALFNSHFAPAKKCLEDLINNNEKVRLAYNSPKSSSCDNRLVNVSVTVRRSGKDVERNVKIEVNKTIRPATFITTNYEPSLQEEINFFNSQLKSDAEERDRQLALQLNENQYEEEGQLIECGCCYGDVTFDDMVQCSEGHLFCQECLQRYAKEATYGECKAQIMCMTDGCDSIFPRSQLQKALSTGDLAKYDDRVGEESLQLADMGDNLVRCPYCNYAAIMSVGDKVFQCQLIDCKKETCRYCKEEWKDHFGIPCDEVEKNSDTKIRVSYEERMTKAKIRTCFRCNTGFTKSEGCNKMTCRCGAKMCYICRKPNINYNHFCRHPRDPGNGCNKCHDCSLWSNPEEDDERAVQEIRTLMENEKKAKEKRSASPEDNSPDAKKPRIE